MPTFAWAQPEAPAVVEQREAARPTAHSPIHLADPFPILYPQAALFRRAITAAESIPVAEAHISGITLPHHLLAANLMAEGFSRIRTQHYDRIILLSPDHHTWGKTPFSVPGRDFSTCLGPVHLDRSAAAALLHNPLVSESSLFSHEHGVQALLPFIAHYFPGVPVLPVTLGVRSKQNEWDQLAADLLPLLTPKTLILQSTDFSHYLTWKEAIPKDQETLRVIMSGNPELVLQLHQPANLDSKAAQYLQMKIQREYFKALPTVVANTNACEYLPKGNPEPKNTTSYIVQLYAEAPLTLPSGLSRYTVAGDFFTGRYLRKHLDNPKTRRELIEKVLQLTDGNPLIVNFEGVLMQACPDKSPQDKGAPFTGHKLCMPQDSTLALLRDLNVQAVSLANNHSHDFGPEAYNKTRQALEQAGIATLGQGETRQLGRITLAAYTDLDNAQEPHVRILTSSDFTPLRQANATKPLVALVHCGQEFHPTPRKREKAIARALEEHGADIFAGAHPHQPGTLEVDAHGVRAWSLGNFLFDQLRPKAGGALLDIVFFPQGTWWVRQREIGNLYKEMQPPAPRERTTDGKQE